MPSHEPTLLSRELASGNPIGGSVRQLVRKDGVAKCLRNDRQTTDDRQTDRRKEESGKSHVDTSGVLNSHQGPNLSANTNYLPPLFVIIVRHNCYHCSSDMGAGSSVNQSRMFRCVYRFTSGLNVFVHLNQAIANSSGRWWSLGGGRKEKGDRGGYDGEKRKMVGSDNKKKMC